MGRRESFQWVSRGLQIGKTTVSHISGPVSAHLLKPTPEFFEKMSSEGVPPPLLLLFGDYHFSSKNVCDSCTCNTDKSKSSERFDERCCYPIASDALWKLFDSIATKSHPIHVNLESYMPKEVKEKISSLDSSREIQHFFQDISRVRQEEEWTGPLGSIMDRNLSCTFQGLKNRHPTLFKQYCPYKNVQWHYIDPRFSYILNVGGNDELDTPLNQYVYEGLMTEAIQLVPLTRLVISNKFTLKQIGIVYQSISYLMKDPEEFCNYVFNETNPMFTSHSFLYKQFKKLTPSLQSMEWLRSTAEKMMNLWAFDSYRELTDRESPSWWERVKTRVRRPYLERLLNKGESILEDTFYKERVRTIQFMIKMFQTQANFCFRADSIDEWDYSDEKTLLKKETRQLSILPRDLFKTTGMNIDLTGWFLDLGYLMRTFKIPVHPVTKRPSPTPMLSIGYFGDRHVQLLINLLTKQLKYYTLEPGSVYVEDNYRNTEQSLRCLNLTMARWDLNELLKPYLDSHSGDVELRSVPKITQEPSSPRRSHRDEFKRTKPIRTRPIRSKPKIKTKKKTKRSRR